MKKKWIAIGTALVMATVMAVPAMAASDFAEEKAKLRPDFTIVIDGKEMNFKRADGSAAYALVYEDSTYLPLRAIGEALGRNVNWDEKTKTITLEGERTTKDSSNKFIKGETKNVWVQVRDDFTIVIDGKEQTFKTSAGKRIFPLLYDGSTYLPLRAIGQIMDRDVDWDNDTKTVTLTSDGYTVTDADSFGEKDKDTVTDADSFKENDNTTRNDIGMSGAKKIALQDAKLKEKDVTFVTTKSNHDDGRKIYEVEFYYDDVEYDYEIDARTGEILDFDKEIEGKKHTDEKETKKEATDEITVEQAKDIALKDAGLTEGQVSKLKVKKDHDDGVVKYKVEFEKDNTEYEYEINAETGKILKSEKDIDD
ncbi:MAG: stalk domain-containing protein [Anaerotignum sp.]|nr:stalk domain-containing protein [Anaerotignum sp.]MDY3926569.1 stalk domain-containing protein [Anaerotignum sp.]